MTDVAATSELLWTDHVIESREAWHGYVERIGSKAFHGERCLRWCMAWDISITAEAVDGSMSILLILPSINQQFPPAASHAVWNFR